MPKPNKKLFLGMTLGRRTDWERFFTTPTAPSNYVDQKKIDKYIAERMEEREAQAQFIPGAGTVHTCVVLDENGDKVIAEHASFGVKEGEISYRVLTAIADMLGINEGYDGEPLAGPWECGAVLFGLNIRDRLRVMALDAISYVNRSDTPTANIPPGLWYSQTFTPGIWCDPYEAVIPSDRRKDIPYNGLCEFLGIELPAGLNLDTDANMQAEVARSIALRTQLTHNRQ